MKQNKSYTGTWVIKLVCLLLAAVTYFVFAYAVQRERKITVPVDIKLPEDYVAASNIPTEVTLVIKGSEERIYMINSDVIKLSADFTNPNAEGVMEAPVVIDIGSLDELTDLTSVSIYTEPSILKIYFEKKVK